MCACLDPDENELYGLPRDWLCGGCQEYDDAVSSWILMQPGGVREILRRRSES